MTLPNERTRAVIYAQKFLRDLLDPKATPKVPLEIRRRARSVLKHFPQPYEMEQAACASPNLFGKVDKADRED